MKTENIILSKSYTFAKRIIKLYQYSIQEKRNFQLADQVLGSGTSIGANVEEAVGGFSRRDFVAKCSIAYKEARETHYWLRLLRDTGYMEERLANSLLEDAEELKKILASIILSFRRENE